MDTSFLRFLLYLALFVLSLLVLSLTAEYGCFKGFGCVASATGTIVSAVFSTILASAMVTYHQLRGPKTPPWMTRGEIALNGGLFLFFIVEMVRAERFGAGTGNGTRAMMFFGFAAASVEMALVVLAMYVSLRRPSGSVDCETAGSSRDHVL
mmetsp:Transcript_2485/g.5719  ORF Transcript_2485/g.5719 Transcript_2485/m.5719 type:complete len:152 (-) Transcript_2485:242-697(-)